MRVRQTHTLKIKTNVWSRFFMRGLPYERSELVSLLKALTNNVIGITLLLHVFLCLFKTALFPLQGSLHKEVFPGKTKPH